MLIDRSFLPLLLRLAAVTAFGAAVPLMATPVTILLNCTSSPTVLQISNTSPTSSGTLLCPQFDPALGGLISVQTTDFGLGSPITGTFNFRNDTASDISVPIINFIILGTLDATLPGFPTKEARGATTVRNVALAAGQSRTFNFDGLWLAGPGGLGGGAPPPGYIGTGTVAGSLVLGFIDNGSNNGPVPVTVLGFTLSTDLSAITRIAYTYEPIPEPTTITMAALGLTGLALLRRSRRG